MTTRMRGLRWIAFPTVTYRGERLHLLGPSGQYRLLQTSRRKPFCCDKHAYVIT